MFHKYHVRSECALFRGAQTVKDDFLRMVNYLIWG